MVAPWPRTLGTFGVPHTTVLPRQSDWLGRRYYAKLYFFGGRSYKDQPDNKLYELDTKNLKWRIVPVASDALPTARYGHHMVSLAPTPQDHQYRIWRGDHPADGDALSPTRVRCCFVSVPAGAGH